MKKTINISWSIDDIRSLGYRCTEKQGSLVLDDIEKYHDASIGINWDVIEFHADNHKLIKLI